MARNDEGHGSWQRSSSSGGAGAIGSAIARRLTARGDRPHLVGRDPVKLGAVAREIGAASSVCDVTDGAAVAAAVAEAAEGGGLAGLVYAVGTINLKPIGSLTEADFERDWRVNALGAALALKAAAPHLKAVEGSSVVLFSTVAVRQGFAAPRLRQHGEGRRRGPDPGAGRRTGAEGAGELHRALADPARRWPRG